MVRGLELSSGESSPARRLATETVHHETITRIRYSFGLRSYWVEVGPLAAALRNVTGENRRQMITDYWKAGQLDRLDPALVGDEAGPVVSRRLGRIQPSFLGRGSFPPYLPGDVEIARGCLRSTTRDVISLRARPVPAGARTGSSTSTAGSLRFQSPRLLSRSNWRS